MTPKKSVQGVYKSHKKNGEVYYRSSLTYKNKHISLGSYSSAEDAHRAYLEAGLLLHNNTIGINQYHKSSRLTFEKWVVILNFRDNGLYFPNPIYISKKLFYYYLSPTLVLKFDIDDLFYYSSHKIMRRGNHYFVADYGMQVNIASRYDIKNYAVIGKDYLFINGDSTDFRRENIKILNTYHGVAEKKDTKGKLHAGSFCAYIHIRGNFLIGTYRSALEAAIAYNKAIDILKKKGVNKNFTPNYIDSIPPSRYAEIYTNVTISDKIINYVPTFPCNPQS